MAKIAIIGAGIAGISAAAYAAKDGHDVHVFEKHSVPGGRARAFTTENGYRFDMGPSWYWMPDIIESFFSDFGCSASDFYTLIRLDPQFDMVFPDGSTSVPNDYQQMRAMFEKMETGAAKKLDLFMQHAKYKYEVGMKAFVEKPCYSWLEFASVKIAKNAFKLNLFSNFRSYVKKYFSHPKLVSLMEFPVIFLGASPTKIPALYSLMNYGGYMLGTWYPIGGFYELVKAMASVAEKQGVKFHFNQQVERIENKGNCASSLVANGLRLDFDAIIASSDYHHTETLLDPHLRNYKDDYWKSRTFAPSCLIYYLGLNKKLPNLKHHTLFFDEDLDRHITTIYETKEWPDNPLFYACCTSKTELATAPEGHENLFLLLPLAPGLQDGEDLREAYLKQMLNRIEEHTGLPDLEGAIDFKRSYCVSDFINDYHAYQGNAYGLANTLSQTAVRKPSIKNKKLVNLFYTGQLTVPGPGVPPAIISGKIVAKEVIKLKSIRYENTV